MLYVAVGTTPSSVTPVIRNRSYAHRCAECRCSGGDTLGSVLGGRRIPFPLNSLPQGMKSEPRVLRF